MKKLLKCFSGIYAAKRPLLAILIIAILGANGPAVRAQNRLPNLGDGTEMTPSAERRMGDRIARELYRDPDYIDDPVLLEYVNKLWQPLLVAARQRGDLTDELHERFAFEVLLGKDRTVNAFALPGGYFGMHLGLIAITTSRDELASVLGHELSHVTQRHIARLISNQSSQSPWLIGAMILGVLAASKSVDAANALIVGGQAAAQQNQLNFSRDMEREADRVGYGVVTQAGFEGRGFVGMFEKLQQNSRLSDSGSYPYLRSHPLTTERISDMQGRVGTTGFASMPTPVVTPALLEHAVLAARAQVLSNPAVDALRAWSVTVSAPGFATQDPLKQAAGRYGAALAAAKLRDFSGTAPHLAALSALTRNAAGAGRQYRLLAAEIALAAGDADKAALHLSLNDTLLKAQDNKRNPPGRPELLLDAATALAQNRAKEAIELLQAWLADHPRDASAWQLRSTAHASAGQSLRAIRADGEARMAQFDYAAAQDRFKAGQETARQLARDAARTGQLVDHIEASILDTRVRAVGLLLREQALER